MDGADRGDVPGYRREDSRNPARRPDAVFLARAMEAAGFGILALDRATGDITYVNEAGAEILRVVSDSFRTETWETFRRTLLAEASAKPRGTAPTARSVSLGDVVVGYSLYPKEAELWVFFRDVTEKHHLSTVAEALRLSDALLGVFSSLRHDLGNSVNAAKTSLDVLRRGLGRHDEDAVRRYVDRALEALARIEALLGALRDYGFASAPPLRPVPIGEIVESVVLDRGRSLAEGGTALDVEVEEGDARVLADPGSLEDALCDLVSRAALRARSEASPAVLVRVEARRETVAIHVSPREVCERAPEPAAEEGDLRLLVVRRLVSQMEGTFDVDGGVATVTLRRARGAD